MSSGTPFPDERDQPYEIPYRQVEHQPGDEDPWNHEETIPGQFPIGHARLDYYPRATTAAEKARWRREDEERQARRIPLGFQ